jgi:hypothetical protein
MYWRTALALLLFLFNVCCIWLIQVRFIKVDVVFYSALGAVGVATLTQVLIFHSLAVFKVFAPFEKFQHFVCCALIGYAIAISIPTVIDRSLSFYILEKLQQRGGGIQQEKFEKIFTGEYIREHRLVDVRLTEQLESGTITIDGGCVRLTSKGENFASFGRFFRRNFLPKRRLLLGEYTDQLTDPFSRSDVEPDYLCPPG